LSLSARSGPLSGSVDGVAQVGRAKNAALGGEHQWMLAWAAQGHATLTLESLVLDINLLALSSDDAEDGNTNEGTFLYSSRSKSARQSS
ncbi:MAG: hypothetical protein ACK2UX_11270, partial [Anaerolineae bacterium]